MINVPKEFQPKYKSTYPCYSSGKNIEEEFYNYYINNNISSSYIYIPVFWTSYYVTHNYGENIQPLYKWLDTLDKTKKYFTIVQYASGIFVKNFNLDILVFSAGGGGLNLKNNKTIQYLSFNNIRRHIFFGNKGDHDIPLICNPRFPELDIKKDIFCSFIGRYDTHSCRFKMKSILEKNKKYLFYNSSNFQTYNKILNRSIFTLAPRGYGYTSFRIYEAILANSIPIYIWEDKKVLPYSDIIDWNDFCIVINSKDINNIDTIISKVNIKEKYKNLQKVKNLFTFNEMFKYINNLLK